MYNSKVVSSSEAGAGAGDGFDNSRIHLGITQHSTNTIAYVAYTLYGVQCTRVHCTLYSVLYTVQCTRD